jgi:uncharacterized protein YjbI with pentapeptide repeats
MLDEKIKNYLLTSHSETDILYLTKLQIIKSVVSNAMLSFLLSHNIIYMSLNNLKQTGINKKLTYDDLSNADLTGADLSGKNLTGAILTGANLYNAKLTRAILTEARLSGAILTEGGYQERF